MSSGLSLLANYTWSKDMNDFAPRLAYGASGVVRSDTLVNSESPQCVSQVWEINEADIQLTDALYPVAQEAMRRGYYMPNHGSAHCGSHQCPHWRRCEQDFGGLVEP